MDDHEDTDPQVSSESDAEEVVFEEEEIEDTDEDGEIEIPEWRPDLISDIPFLSRGFWILAGLITLVAAGLYLVSTERTSIGLVLAGLGGVTAVFLIARHSPILFNIRYPIRELNNKPTEKPTVTVPRHGVVHRGQTDVPLGGDRTRPYIWIWIDPAANNDCAPDGEYRWYQYVKLKFFINSREKRLRSSIKGATGLNYKFGIWNPDYHKKEVHPSDPGLKPPGLGLPANKPGKPFKKYEVPGSNKPGSTTRLTGVLDAPDFCNRGKKALSPIERLLGRFIKTSGRTKVQTNQPPDQNVAARVEIEARTYLVCVKDGQATCIGYVPWDYTISSTLTLRWSRDGTVLGSRPQWKLGSSLGPCTYTLTIKDWVSPC